MTKDFYERLFQGIGIEHHLIGELLLNKYDATKMPTDFGYDIMATNQFRLTFLNQKEEHKSFFFQVKYRSVNLKTEEKTSAGFRKVTEIDFLLKAEELNHLLAEPRAFLVCYFLTNENGHNFKIIDRIFLSSSYLNKLNNNGYITDNTQYNKKSIRFRYSTDADLKPEILDEIKKTGNKRVEYLLGKTDIIKNTNSNENFYIINPSNTNGKEYVKPEHKSLSYIETGMGSF